jgi:two-component system, OmpR family, sensor histidine kinase KdpD
MTRPSRSLWRKRVFATALSLGAVALVTAAIFALEPIAPVLSLGVLYLLAVLPVAALFGLAYAVPISIVSLLAFNFFFLPPRHTFSLADSENWVALAVYLVTAIVVSGLADRARRRTAEAEQRRREATLAAEISALLLESHDVRPQLERIAGRVASMLGGTSGRIELHPTGFPYWEEIGLDLTVGEREVGRLFLVSSSPPDPEVAARVCATVASLLATAIEREELARHVRESEARRRSEAIEAESLRRSEAAKAAVLRSVSHDLRSPITAIMAASEVLESSGDSLATDERAELLASISAQVRRLDRLVSNVLELSRLEAGAANPLLELWTVDGLVARALDAVGPDNERIEVALPESAPPVHVDATQLEHVLVNLLDNALKFSPETDRVLVRADQLDGQVVVRVIDHGPGIAAEDREHIFEPFDRGGRTDGGGSGLGLAIARGFAQLNGGTLWVESEPGNGSTFALALPAAEAANVP